MMNNPRTAILLACHNGEKYLAQQLESLFKQKDADITVFIRDDGSSDHTKEILKTWESEKCILFFEDNIGAAESFLWLMDRAEGFDYYAFCDQDDLWDSDKISCAVKQLEAERNRPSLYFSAKRIIGEDGTLLEEKSMSAEAGVYSLEKAVLGNNATGCTMVVNRRMRDLTVKYRPERMIMHDHWLYLLCLAAGGRVVYDDMPHMSYRQHGGNTLGDKIPLRKRLKNSSARRGKNLRRCIVQQILEQYAEEIPEENRRILREFALYQNGFQQKMALIRRIRAMQLSHIRKMITAAEILMEIF
ncbi:MAG: glycosyltransferase family 2 protein [Lachnospiraceae bacterium]|nr:glycosyltransferase family 2 protein [Lachnospiraceae bacterium]